MASAAELCLVSAGQGSLARQLCKSGKTAEKKGRKCRGHDQTRHPGLWGGGTTAASPTSHFLYPSQVSQCCKSDLCVGTARQHHVGQGRPETS